MIPVQAPQKRQTRCGLPLKQHQDDREIRELYPFIERLVVFKLLPIADTLLAHEQDEGVRLRNFLGKSF